MMMIILAEPKVPLLGKPEFPLAEPLEVKNSINPENIGNPEYNENPENIGNPKNNKKNNLRVYML